MKKIELLAAWLRQPLRKEKRKKGGGDESDGSAARTERP